MSQYKTVLFIFILLLCTTAFGQVEDLPSETNDTQGEDFIISIMNRVNDHQFKVSRRKENRNWKQATYYTGVMAFYQATKDQKLLNQAISWSSKHDWEVGNELMFPANRFTCVQTYLEIFFHTKDTSQILKAKKYMDSRLSLTEPAYLRGWYYIDALYVGPPAFVMMSVATGDDKYIKYINPVFWEVADQLYDEETGLFYRDSEARFNEKSKNGKKVLWSRGNGWVMASLPRILSYLPKDDPYYEKYQSLLRTMANTLKGLQNEDGLWRVNLDDPDEYPMPESSGTAFFTYALTWGINNNILDPQIFEPVVKKAWKGLCGAVNEEGKVCWGQSVARGPRKVNKEDSDAYVSGAFLLAGSEMLKLVNSDKK
jgi:rhamnogalacturonyl hydrolase YesR